MLYFAVMIRLVAIIFTSFMCARCEQVPQDPEMKCWKVKVTAYNSLAYQTRPGTDGTITAWGDKLVDSIPSIAISRDLLDSGLTHGTQVWIEGYTYPFVVNDKMNRRYRNRIDIHMGKDVKKAREFGVKTLRLCIDSPTSDESANDPN